MVIGTMARKGAPSRAMGGNRSRPLLPEQIFPLLSAFEAMLVRVGTLRRVSFRTMDDNHELLNIEPAISFRSVRCHNGFSRNTLLLYTDDPPGLSGADFRSYCAKMRRRPSPRRQFQNHLRRADLRTARDRPADLSIGLVDSSKDRCCMKPSLSSLDPADRGTSAITLTAVSASRSMQQNIDSGTYIRRC
jgi:hypothetical protein